MTMSNADQFKLFATHFDTSGRVHLPSELRKEIGVSSGTPVVWVRTEDGLMLRRYDRVVNEVQDYFSDAAMKAGPAPAHG